MNVLQVHKLSRVSQLSLLAVVILLGGIFFTVNSAMQEQNTASNAASGPNILVNSSFESGTTDWILNKTSPGTGIFTTTTNQHEDGVSSAQIAVTGSSSNLWYVQLKEANVGVQSGKTYTVTFWAKAASTRQIGSVIQEGGGSYTIYGSIYPNITTIWQKFSYTFTANATDPTAFIAFNVASATGNVWIDNVSYTTGIISPTATPMPTAKPIPTVIPTVKPTAVPTKAPTAVPTVKPTAIPTPKPTATTAPGLPTSTPAPTAKPTAIPTVVPTATPTPKPTAVPTQVPQPTATPVPGNTTLSFTVGLHGIGTGGDSANPTSLGNTSPLTTTRTITADIYNAQNQLVVSQQGTTSYDSASGKFIGNLDLGTNFANGLYTVKIKTDQYLRALVPGIQTITSGKTNNLPVVTLVAGDINGDNQINIVDYNILIGCYSDLLPATNCTAANNVLSDLNDDGHVNAFDYNLFLRELTNIGGQ